MREIKFRVWNKKNKYFNFEGVEFWGLDHAIGDLCFDSSECDNFVIQQYTGEKDKDGCEIYEGDILGYTIGPNTLVKWTEEGMDYVGWAFSDLYSQGGPHGIIGNIFENPELNYYGKD